MPAISAMKSRISFATIFSIVVHVAVAVYFMQTAPEIATKIESSIRAFNMQKIRVNFVQKKQPPVHVVKKFEKVAYEKPIVEENEPEQEAIPVIENATLRGERTPPKYPKRALMLRQQGVATIQALIDIDGKINRVEVLQSSGYKMLDKSALAAVLKWDFEPTYIEGKAVLSWVKVPVEFTII